MNKAKVVSSLIYKFAERFSVKGIGLVISIILARLIAPEYFGQIAIINVFVGLSQTLVESGLNTALVQSKEVDDSDYSTVFYICMGISALLVLLLFAVSPAIGAFYNNSGLVLPLRVYSLSLFFGAFNSIQTAIIQRELRFKQQFVCSIISTALSGAFGIVLAYLNAGIWALIGYYFLYSVISSISMFIAVRWRPRSRFSKASAKRLYAYGLRIFASSMLTSIYNDIRPLIIGKQFTEADLAYYDRGHQFSSLIALNIDNAVTSVMFPVLSSLQDQRERLTAAARRAMGVNALLIFPAMFGMAAVAEPMIRLLLTDRWLPCVVFVQILCIGEAQVPITTTNLVVLKALGRSDIYMKQEAVRRAAMLAVLLISVFVFKSTVAIAAGFMVSAWLDAFITSIPLKKLLGFGFADEFKELGTCLAATALMTAAVYAMNYLALPLAARLALQIAVGGAVYAGMCLLLKERSFMYLVSTVRDRLGRNTEKGEKHI